MSKPTVRAAFVAVTTLFFAWGFITSLIAALIGPGMSVRQQRAEDCR